MVFHVVLSQNVLMSLCSLVADVVNYKFGDWYLKTGASLKMPNDRTSLDHSLASILQVLHVCPLTKKLINILLAITAQFLCLPLLSILANKYEQFFFPNHFSFFVCVF